MVVVGFNFTKINVERKNPIKGKVKITNNVAIKKIDQQEMTFGKTKQKGLKLNFEFVTKYEKDFGSITLAGELLYLDDEKVIKDVVDKWNNKKSIPKNVMSQIINNILNKSQIQALILSQQINLPAPVPLPKVGVSDKKK